MHNFPLACRLTRYRASTGPVDILVSEWVRDCGTRCSVATIQQMLGMLHLNQYQYHNTECDADGVLPSARVNVAFCPVRSGQVAKTWRADAPKSCYDLRCTGVFESGTIMCFFPIDSC